MWGRKVATPDASIQQELRCHFRFASIRLTTMLRFAANLTTMYQEYRFLDRFAAAARDGFSAVEYLFPYDYPARELASKLTDHGLQQVLINAPPGNWEAGDRGIACLPGRHTEFRASIDRAITYSETLGCSRLHVMAGVSPGKASRSELRDTYVANIAWAAAMASRANKDILIEPINLGDIPGYLLNTQEEAHAIVAEINMTNLKVQMDLYHCQIVEGNVALMLQRYLGGPKRASVGHLQIAGVPGRHEPDCGELEYGPLFRLIDELDFSGWIGCEYRPKAGTSEGLNWLRMAGDV